MRDDNEQVKIELHSQWKLEAEFRNCKAKATPGKCVCEAPRGLSSGGGGGGEVQDGRGEVLQQGNVQADW